MRFLAFSLSDLSDEDRQRLIAVIESTAEGNFIRPENLFTDDMSEDRKAMISISSYFVLKDSCRFEAVQEVVGEQKGVAFRKLEHKEMLSRCQLCITRKRYFEHTWTYDSTALTREDKNTLKKGGYPPYGMDS